MEVSLWPILMMIGIEAVRYVLLLGVVDKKRWIHGPNAGDDVGGVVNW